MFSQCSLCLLQFSIHCQVLGCENSLPQRSGGRNRAAWPLPAFIADLLVKANATHSLSFLSGAALKTCSASRSCCTAEMEAMLGAFTTAQFKSTVERNGGAVVDVFRNKGKRIDGKPWIKFVVISSLPIRERVGGSKRKVTSTTE